MKYIITGASNGIGKRCAERLLQQGDSCVLIARSRETMETSFKMYSDRVYIVPTDLREIDAIESIFAQLDDRFLPLDGMVHCAGIAPLMRVDENDSNTVREAYTINVFSFIELMRCFVREGLCRDGASVVAMSSVVAHRASNRQSVYSGTKAALEATVRCIAKELIGRSIRVNAIASGTVETSMLQKLREKSSNLDDKIRQHYPLGIIPADIVCDLIEYLLSAKALNITGATVPLDSGYFLN